MRVLIIILSILFLASGCESEPASVSRGNNSAEFIPKFDSPPQAYNIPYNILYEDTESGIIFLPYSDEDNDVATSCHILNRNKLIVTEPCACYGGICSVRVKPFQNATGDASFTYTVMANNAFSNVGTISFFIIPVSDVPVANELAITLIEDSKYVSAGTQSMPHLSGTDPDEDTLTCIKVTNPSHGQATVNSNCSFEYEPNPGFKGKDQFTFRVSDGTNLSDPAIVDITVLKKNSPPVAIPQSITTVQNKEITFTLNVSDADGDPLYFSIVTSPQNGTVTRIGNHWTYLPANNFTGNDSFTYVASDGKDDSVITTVSITIHPPTLYLSMTGNDATGALNDPSRPFATAQGVVDAAIAYNTSPSRPLRIEVAPGNYGDIVISSNFGRYVTWIGTNAATTIIGNIIARGKKGNDGMVGGNPANGEWDGGDGTSGHEIVINSDFNITFGNITTDGGDGGLHAPDTINQLAKPGVPGKAGNITLTGIFGNISAVGGSGHAGEAGGNVVVKRGSVTGSINTSGGQDLCTKALFCITSIDSGNGGKVEIEADSRVNGSITANGGWNNGVNNSKKYAGHGGDIIIHENVVVTGNVTSKGGSTWDSITGKGGNVTAKSGSVINGDINVIAGEFLGDGTENIAGTVEVHGTVRDIYANTYLLTGGFGGHVTLFGQARDIYVESHDVNCEWAGAGSVIIRETGIVDNVYAWGGNSSCDPDRGGFIKIFGRVNGLATVDGGDNLEDSEVIDNPGSGGTIQVYASAVVNDLSSKGGSAFAGSCKNGGNGGRVEIVPGASYDSAKINVAGGAGDSSCGRPGGAMGIITTLSP